MFPTINIANKNWFFSKGKIHLINTKTLRITSIWKIFFLSRKRCPGIAFLWKSYGQATTECWVLMCCFFYKISYFRFISKYSCLEKIHKVTSWHWWLCLFDNFIKEKPRLWTFCSNLAKFLEQLFSRKSLHKERF